MSGIAQCEQHISNLTRTIDRVIAAWLALEPSQRPAWPALGISELIHERVIWEQQRDHLLMMRDRERGYEGIGHVDAAWRD